MRSVILGIIITFLTSSLVWASGDSEELPPGLYAEMQTSRGTMVFELDYENTPLTVASFVGLAKGILNNDLVTPGQPFYDGSIIYKKVPDYVIFSGDPTGNGTGSPGYSLPRETTSAFSTGKSGTLVMNGYTTESSGSLFFITLAGDAFLDTKYTAFGRIIRGKQVLKKLQQGDVIEHIKIQQIGATAMSLSLNQEIFDGLLESGRMAELNTLDTIAPALGESVRALGTKRQKTNSGIYYAIIEEGTGTTPKTGDKVSMHYTGSLIDGTVFDSSHSRKQTFDFILGRDRIISGWIEMIVGMTSGEVRRVIIPPDMAYGETGFGPIEPNSWLIFDMELVRFAKE